MKNFRPTLRLNPSRWMGITFGYNDAMFNFMKDMPCKAFDKETKTWWFPEGSLPLVITQAIATGCITPEAAFAFEAQHKTVKLPVTHAEALSTLCLQPGAPDKLIAKAREFWLNEWLSTGGSAEKLNEVEEAYRILVRANS